MKNNTSGIPLAARNWLSDIGRKGGRAGSAKNKRKAALARWDKPGARKTKIETSKSISRNQAGE